MKKEFITFLTCYLSKVIKHNQTLKWQDVKRLGLCIVRENQNVTCIQHNKHKHLMKS